MTPKQESKWELVISTYTYVFRYIYIYMIQISEFMYIDMTNSRLDSLLRVMEPMATSKNKASGQTAGIVNTDRQDIGISGEQDLVRSLRKEGFRME